MPSRLVLGSILVAGVFGFFAIGLIWARDPFGALLGVGAGLVSASAWAVGAISGRRWNAALNVFAALLAAGSLGFLAPLDRVCGWHQLLLLCR
jgi:hypothetical protein